MPKIPASKEIRILILLTILSLFFHLFNFTDRLNFSTDQAKFALKSLEIWDSGKISLIGPSTSFNLEGREIFQGGVIYYMFLIFLFLGNLDPVNSSLIFAVFSVFTGTALYFGLSMIFGKQKSLLITALYLLLPTFINYTNFLWNPNFQLSMLPIFFLILGFYKKTKNLFLILLAGFWLGFLTMFHYQMVIGWLLLILWLKLYLKISFSQILLFILGGVIGFSPILLFEIRNNFYNFNTILFFLQNFSKLSGSGSFSLSATHYYISLSLIVLVIAVSFLKHVSTKLLIALITLLVLYDAISFIPKAAQGFGMARNWKYENEKQVSEIVKSQNLDNYNFTNLEYDSLYYVQKYLNYINGNQDKITDYWDNQNLFAVINKEEKPEEDPAYEIQVIKPFEIINTWDINPSYKLYQLKKATK